jgi:Pterin 4 alpha carbinolamine dehydratase
VGDLAETEGHHPDISFGWGYATISLHTKKIKGLHENDFIMRPRSTAYSLARPRAERVLLVPVTRAAFFGATVFFDVQTAMRQRASWFRHKIATDV